VLKVLLADCWWLVRFKRKVLLAAWLLADKPNERGESNLFYHQVGGVQMHMNFSYLLCALGYDID
jgi:hypothetical protein